MVEHTPQRHNSNSRNPINEFAETFVDFASQQRPQMSSAFFKPTTTNTLTFDSNNEKFELLEDLFQSMLKIQQELEEAMKINNFFHLSGNTHYKSSETIIPATNEHLKRYSSYSDEKRSNHEPMLQKNTNGTNSCLTLTRKRSQISLRS